MDGCSVPIDSVEIYHMHNNTHKGIKIVVKNSYKYSRNILNVDASIFYKHCKVRGNFNVYAKVFCMSTLDVTGGVFFTDNAGVLYEWKDINSRSYYNNFLLNSVNIQSVHEYCSSDTPVAFLVMDLIIRWSIINLYCVNHLVEVDTHTLQAKDSL